MIVKPIFLELAQEVADGTLPSDSSPSPMPFLPTLQDWHPSAGMLQVTWDDSQAPPRSEPAA
ncbi:hypothetical protein K456DRAFT_47742 [Colletotrichum gloeosporioides 23]|uniref:Uncharacterized protein n=1 Tax=Colletotrichum asianum TaxID=702518 RepID=A0A8H3ZTA8_9PEZI|nr:hypothetical protein GQ607_001928 [Colletotrichum asianum]KAH9239736.1 hypothetical protein K456DRAFT_47742 [Colletotrichum gloeosporioides 23]